MGDEERSQREEAELVGTADRAAETGECEGVTLTADEERELHAGDELDILLPAEAADEGWSYEIEGDFRAVDVYERAELVTTAGSRHTPVGGSWRFVVRAERRGKATVRFEPAGGAQPLRLRIRVR